MTDERDIAHDQAVAQDQQDDGHAVVENAAIVPQPGGMRRVSGQIASGKAANDDAVE